MVYIEINHIYLAPEENRDLNTLKNQWHTDSTKQTSTVATYAKYQVQTYLETKGKWINILIKF